MLYEYGIVDFEFLRKQLSKYMNEIITETELRDIYFTRLNLNTFINDYNIRWTNTNEIQPFVTYLDYEWTFKRLLKNNELGIDILGDLSNMCMFEDDKELKKFMDLFTDWYNNSPQYMLGGYSPIEFRETFK